MKKKSGIIIAVLIILIIAIVVAIVVMLSGSKGYRQVKVDDVDGDVLVVREKDDELDAFEGMKLVTEDEVQVDSDSSVVLLVDDDKHIGAEENTKFKIVATGSVEKGEVEVKLIEGKALFTIDNKLPDDSIFKVKTANATFSVRGTEFEVAYDKDNDLTTLEVLEGVVRVKYEGDMDSEDVEAGESRVITNDDVYTGDIEDGIEFFTGIVIDAEDDELAEEDTYNDGAEEDDTEDSREASASIDLTADGNDKSIRAAYQRIIDNMENYAASERQIGRSYDQYDYMYFDYDGDGMKEVILYLRYLDEERETYLDLAFLDYFEDEGAVGIRAINRYDKDDSCFYCEYNGKLARYSWRTSPYESYLYYVEVRDDSLIYVLEQGWDEIISDIDAAGMHPLPLYGYWEMLPD